MPREEIILERRQPEASPHGVDLGEERRRGGAGRRNATTGKDGHDSRRHCNDVSPAKRHRSTPEYAPSLASPPMPDRYGCRSMVDPLRRVFVRRPSIPACTRWQEYGWRAEPNPTALLLEHEAFCAILEGAGCDVVVAEPMDADPDAVYAFDPAVVTEHGAILMRPGKPGRRDEPAAAARDLERVDVPVAAHVDDPSVAEGGDFIRLDEATLLAGRGYRTSPSGIEAVAQALPGVETLTFDLPHWHGQTEVMHLLSLLSPLDADLVVAYPPLLPVALAQLFAERGDRDRPRARRGVREHGDECARPCSACRARAGRQSRDARQARGRGCGGARLRGARALAQGRRRANMSHEPSPVRSTPCLRCLCSAARREAQPAGTSGARAAARGSSGGASSGAPR